MFEQNFYLFFFFHWRWQLYPLSSCTFFSPVVFTHFSLDIISRSCVYNTNKFDCMFECMRRVRNERSFPTPNNSSSSPPPGNHKRNDNDDGITTWCNVCIVATIEAAGNSRTWGLSVSVEWFSWGGATYQFEQQRTHYCDYLMLWLVRYMKIVNFIIYIL